MTTTTSGPHGSPWLAALDPIAPRPALVAPLRVDVAVVGAGIVGLTTALLLAREGVRVAVLEADRVGGGVSGASTAKVTSAHGLAYDELERRHGSDAARTYAQAQEGALGWMRDHVRDRDIACDWRARDAYTFTEDPDWREELEREADAARRAGLPVADAAEVPEPFRAVAGLRVLHQAEFHPTRYLLALAAEVEELGGAVHERSRATGVKEADPCVVTLATGAEVLCGQVVVATHAPFLDRGGYFARLAAERSYAVALAAPSGSLPDGMFYATGDRTRSVRVIPGDREDLLVVGGAGHKSGQRRADDAPFEELAAWGRERFRVGAVRHRWSAQDLHSVDGLPYVGHYWAASRRLWVATGLRKWGYTNGTAAAMVLAQRIHGRTHPWAGLFDADRLRPIAAGPRFVRENANVARRMIGDPLRTRLRAPAVEDLEPGQGRIVRREGRKVAAYLDEDGSTLHLCSATCTHLGCELRFNDSERSWDCPCHGSRFDTRGAVLEGPAVDPLEHAEHARDVPARRP